MKFKLNFVADKPTKNGRVYPNKALKEALSKKDIMVTLSPTVKPEIDLRDVVGIANLSEFKKDKIEFDVRSINKELLNIANNNLLTASMFGRVDENNIVHNLHLLSFSPVMNTEPDWIDIILRK